jgi:uncharacterized protein (UPF0147 family)
MDQSMTNTETINVIIGCIDLLDRYEKVLIQISKDSLCPENLRVAAKKVLDYGAELVED